MLGVVFLTKSSSDSCRCPSGDKFDETQLKACLPSSYHRMSAKECVNLRYLSDHENLILYGKAHQTQST